MQLQVVIGRGMVVPRSNGCRTVVVTIALLVQARDDDDDDDEKHPACARPCAAMVSAVGPSVCASARVRLRAAPTRHGATYRPISLL